MNQKRAIIATAGLLLVLAASWLALTSRGNGFTDVQNQNKAIFDRAIKERNPGLCYQLDGKVPYPTFGPNDEPLGPKLIDQETARKYCTENAVNGRYYGP